MDRSRIKVVLVHGIGANRLVMWPLARRLRKNGFSVTNWGYRSLWSPIKKHGRDLGSLIATLDQDDDFDCIALVAHSMGCIVSRSAIEFERPAKLKRAIFLAPPNRGSPVADVLSRWVGWLSPPARELLTAEDSFVNQLPDDIEVPLGIITARIDWLVPLDSTHLPCQSDRTMVGGIHSAMPWRKDVVQLVERFVTHQAFEGADDESFVESHCETT